MSDLASPPRAEVLDVFVELLSEVDADQGPDSRDFYDRCCEAICRLTSMRRAGLLLYDATSKLVVPVGSHGIPEELLGGVHGTLEETPVAQRALSEDRVVEVSEALERELPVRYAQFPGVTTLTCTPVSAAGRWLGVIFADRGGGRFALTDPERHTMWTLGKTAALATSARIATAQQGRAHQLSERVDLARDVHDRVMQRLFGVSLVIGSEHGLSPAERARCRSEIQAALADLREALARPPAPATTASDATLEDELRRLGDHYRDLPLVVSWELEERLPPELEPLAQSVLAEALRNADKHARPSRVEVRVGAAADVFTLEVRNDGIDGAASAPSKAGMGLRLAAFEALQRGGVLEFGPQRDEWRTRLVVPLR